ncbi:hypothetical protein N7472_004722 [Penicillium cf. griseofulvum]|uniref:Uncharacterized protein n=1 Tax=Penicillium cf. griseofulvum TaxID=2972120 RepID=A0A9W9JM70_9EURO|nr:hypothetical protein N7472_004722 [Penicillium cf. griseofulvum]
MYAVLGRCGRRDIPAFNEAIIAVRATKIVVEHFQKGQFPPTPFPLPLGVNAQEPSSDEVQQVLDWEHLIRCIEDICFHNTEWGRQCHYLIYEANSAKRPSKWFTWRQNFRRSMYQSFMMGAVLCRAYQESLAPSNKDDLPEHFLENFDKRLEDPHNPENPLMTSDEMAYLLKYPVFNFEAYDDQHPIYGQLADFLRQQAENHQPFESEILDMYPEDATPDQIDRDHAKVLYAEIVQCLFSSMTLLEFEGAPKIFKEEDEKAEKLSREVTIVPLGLFYPERFTMPANPRTAHKALLLKQPLSQKKKCTTWHPSSQFMNIFLEIMYSSSGQPNHYGEEYPTPPPPLQVFQYVSRTFLGLRFSDDAFEDEDVDAAHKLFMHHPLICGIFLDGWPDLIPTLFDTLDGEGEYDAYYA